MTDTCPNCARLTSELNRILDRHETRTTPDTDDVQRFVATTMLGGRVLVDALYARYLSWCQESSLSPRGKNSFGMALTTLGFGVHRGTAGVRYRTGLH